MKYENRKMEMVIDVCDDRSVIIQVGDDRIDVDWREFWSLLRLMNDAAKEVKF